MWKNIFKPVSYLRGVLNENNSLTVSRTLTSLSQTNLNNISNKSSIETYTCKSNKSRPLHSTQTYHSAQALKLVTAYSGFSKEIFSSRKIPILNNQNKSNFIFGDDSFFTASLNAADVLGVADGVGGWREVGVDPSIFSSNLMKQCKRIVELETETFSNSEKITNQTPLDVLISSYNALTENKEPNLIGSSTACIIVFNRESKFLYSANLGDSGYVVIRNNKIVHRSQEQHHYFNAPFQLALLPYMSNGHFNDSPERASISSFELAEGDFIVMATDGLWDNLSESALLLKISNIKNYTLQDLEKAAKSISTTAVELSKDPMYISPFSLNAKKNGYEYQGGKPDDITVLLARVTKEE